MTSFKLNIRPEYSATAPKGYPSRSIKLAISLLKLLNVQSVIEVGCGLLANTQYLLESFRWVILVDTSIQLARIKKKLHKLKATYPSLYTFISSEEFKDCKLNFDSAIILNVLHVLPSEQKRIELLKNVYSNLKGNGIIYVDSPRGERYYRKLVRNKQTFRDGWLITGRNGYSTFYKELTIEEILRYLHKAGFEGLYYPKLDHRVIVLAEKI